MGAGLAAAHAWPAMAETRAFQIASLVLYLPNQAMVERGPPAQALIAYIDALKDKANTILSQTPNQAGASGSLVVGLKPPAQSRVWVVMADKSRKAEFVSLLKAPLEQVQAPQLTGLNAFAINFNAWGGAQPPVPPGYPIPDEWIEAMKRIGGGGIMPDAPMKAAWPD
jgi:hypothetical protein